MYGMAQQWSFVKDPLIIAMWVVLAVSLTVISISIYQEQNTSSDVNNNASKNELVFPITDHHAPIMQQPDPETGTWLPVSPQQESAGT
jgi:hypothetical protein